ncbi:MAG: hypothetical protein A3D10_08345 [Omnitrophica WOR_2 bacterium RIFCSPHIGHO2_02_FULL_48_11]|nr:MAG: hypothetical protein A3D10_08345 [Omnitrophica WOR_2 bacterium RIFCSPHIGHO2_02_FULL_48_11]
MGKKGGFADTKDMKKEGQHIKMQGAGIKKKIAVGLLADINTPSTIEEIPHVVEIKIAKGIKREQVGVNGENDKKKNEGKEMFYFFHNEDDIF